MIDLHAHLEGSLSDRVVSTLSRRHGLPRPSLRFSGFKGFLKSFGAVCDLLCDERDFFLAASDLFECSRRRGVLHMEVLISPQVFMRRGIPLEVILRGLLEARRQAVKKRSFSTIFIVDGVRQWGGEWFEQIVRSLAPYAGKGIAGIGVGGDESAVPARDFAKAFRLARSYGLGLTIHAGEAGGAQNVADAIEWLHPDRIGHGIRSAESDDLMELLARGETVFEVCPSSNLGTGVVRTLGEHPFRELFDAGVPVTLNSDDGSFFGTDVTREFRLAVRQWKLSHSEISTILSTAAGASFLSPAMKRDLRRRLRRRLAIS